MHRHDLLPHVRTLFDCYLCAGFRRPFSRLRRLPFNTPPLCLMTIPISLAKAILCVSPSNRKSPECVEDEESSLPELYHRVRCDTELGNSFFLWVTVAVVCCCYWLSLNSNFNHPKTHPEHPKSRRARRIKGSEKSSFVCTFSFFFFNFNVQSMPVLINSSNRVRIAHFLLRFPAFANGVMNLEKS